MKYYWQVTVVLIVHAFFSLSVASLFSDECLRNAYGGAYDATTDSCWIAESTPATFEMARTRCNHMPGYEGHLGFPKTAAEVNFISTKLQSKIGYGWIGLYHFGSAPNNKSEWFWTYPNGTMANASAVPWNPSYPVSNSGYECGYPLGPYLYSTTCDNAGFAGFYCQYERKTAHHETTLEHRCKQFVNWFWWEKSKSCLLFPYSPGVVGDPVYSKLMCTQIPGYRGHLAHLTNLDKLLSTTTFFTTVNPVVYMWTGLERDANVTTANVQDGLYWRRDDGYALAKNKNELTDRSGFSDGKSRYVTLGIFGVLRDWPDTGAAAPLCEYQEDLKYAPTPLDMKCANLSLPHLYYKGSCYVRVETKVTFPVAKTSCNHIDGFDGHLAVLHNSELLNIIYNTLTLPYGGYNWYWLGLERLNTTLTNASAGYYWNTGNGQYFPLTDFSAFPAGYPSGSACGNGYLQNLYTYGACTTLFPYVCEYVEPQKGHRYRMPANLNNKKTIGQAIIKLYDDLYMPEQCGWQCTKELACRSIAFNAATGICLLQSLDSSAASSYLQTADGYVWYDRY